MKDHNIYTHIDLGIKRVTIIVMRLLRLLVFSNGVAETQKRHCALMQAYATLAGGLPTEVRTPHLPMQ